MGCIAEQGVAQYLFFALSRLVIYRLAGIAVVYGLALEVEEVFLSQTLS